MMLNRWIIAAMICAPMNGATGDDDKVPPLPPVPPVPEAPPIPPVPPVPDVDSGDWEEFGNAIGEFVNGIGEWIGDVGRNVGQSVGRSFRFSEGGNFNMAKAEAGNYTEIRELKSIRPGGTIEIENIVGTVKVEGWKRDEIEITGRLGEDVERLLFNIDGDDARIKVVVPKGRKLKIKTELIIRVPRRITLEIITITAPIDVSDVQGDRHEFETVTGSITLNAVSGELELQTVSGRVTVEDADSDVEAGSVSGRIFVGGKPRSVEAKSISGRIEISGVQNRVSVKTISGRVNIQAKELSRLNAESITGSFVFEGGLSDDAEVDISSLSGPVRLTLNQAIEGSYDLQSHSGSNRVDFGDRSYGPARNLRFTHGDGDADIRIESFSGSIRISD